MFMRRWDQAARFNVNLKPQDHKNKWVRDKDIEHGHIYVWNKHEFELTNKTQKNPNGVQIFCR